MSFYKWFLWSKFLRKRDVTENYWINFFSENKIPSTATLKDINALQIQLVKISMAKRERDC